METWVPDDGPDGGHWEPDPLPDDYEPSWMAHTKTQYAGARIHLKVVQLLKLIAEKYLLEFECHDETGFWDHCDEHKLMQRFGEFAL
jgi:hypothetical protein